MGAKRQQEVYRWAVETFGEIAVSKNERAARFLEEALELAQAVGLNKSTAEKILHRVYGRDPGLLSREFGQAGMTLEALAESLDYGLDGLIDAEFLRVRCIPKEEWIGRQNAKADIGIAGPSGSSEEREYGQP